MKSEAIRRQRPGKGAWLCFLAQQGDVLPPKARLYGARYYALLAKGAHKPQLAAVALRLFLADPGARNIGLAPEPSLAVRFAPAPSRQEIASVLGSRPQAQAPEGERPPSSDSVEFLLLLGFGSLFVVLVLRSHRKLRRA
ncbi:MAG: hypothetical protein CSA62_13805 [Planctomycetota bacterium]|nr:MAG: hypothetical protein CSA62_13805 [Planctomycetota bacterium]